jgi:hypothetical protein
MFSELGIGKGSRGLGDDKLEEGRRRSEGRDS